MIFTHTKPNLDEVTGQITPTTSQISGQAFLISRGDPLEYEALKLLPSMAPTLFFVPEGYPLKAYTPEFLLPGDTCVFNGVPMTVRAVYGITAPDGYVVCCYVIIST